MTDETKGDGMTLKEIRDRLWASRGLGGIELGNDEFEQILSSLDHLAAQSATRLDVDRAMINRACDAYEEACMHEPVLHAMRAALQAAIGGEE